MSTSEIVMYVRPYCSDVEHARSILKQHGVTWSEIDIEQDADAAAKVRDWNDGRAPTPTLWIGETMLVEPGQREIDAALAKEGFATTAE